MKRILYFIAGVATGVVGVHLYELLAVPVLPCVDPATYVPEPKVTDEHPAYELAEKLANGLHGALWKAHISALGEALKVLYPPDGVKPEGVKYDRTWRIVTRDELMSSGGERDHWLDQFSEPDLEDMQPVRVDTSPGGTTTGIFYTGGE